MQPEISQFLSGIRRVMEQVVITNLTDRFAQDQANCIVGTLAFLQDVQDKAYHYELLENHLYKRLLRDAAAAVETDPRAAAIGSEVLRSIRAQFEADPIDSPAHLRPLRFLRASNETMRELLAALIQRQDQLPAAVVSRIEGLLAPFFKEMQVRERAWVKAFGFDNLPDPAPNLDDVLYRDGHLHLPAGN